MSTGKVKASKVKVHAAPEGTRGLDGHFHVYVYDVFNKTILPGKSFDTIERAAQHQRREQERIYAEQEATPDLFDLPFVSNDPDLLRRVDSDPGYGARLGHDLDGEARGRARPR